MMKISFKRMALVAVSSFVAVASTLSLVSPVAAEEVVDTTRPNVRIVSPVNGDLVPRNKPVTIQAQASDNVGVTEVYFRVGTSLGPVTLCAGDATLTSCTWTPTKKGAQTITVTAFDAAGNSRTASILLNVY